MEPVDWTETVTDPDERRVFEALADEQWDWRTVNALSRESGLSEAEVRGVLAKYPEFVRQSRRPSKSGADLYTLRKRYYQRKTFFEKSWDFLSSSSTSS